MPKTRVEFLNSKVQYGRGKAASVYGQTYDVLRLTAPPANGSIFNNPPVAANFPYSMEKTTGKKLVEAEIFDIQAYIGTGSAMNLVYGDVLTETGFEAYSGDTFVFAQSRPFLGKNIFVKCESKISVTRPQPFGGASGQQPSSGTIMAPGHIGIAKKNEQVLTLADGLYEFSAAGSSVTGAGIPANLVQMNRVRDGNQPKIPVGIFRDHFCIFVPLLPGVQLQEYDRLNFSNSDRYEIISLEIWDTVFQGNICICEKTAT